MHDKPEASQENQLTEGSVVATICLIINLILNLLITVKSQLIECHLTKNWTILNKKYKPIKGMNCFQ